LPDRPVFFDASTYSGLAKERVDPVSIQWQAWAYSGGLWVRNGSIDLNSGTGNVLSLSAADSVQFKNAAGAVIQIPDKMLVKSGEIRHGGLIHAQDSTGSFIDVTANYTLSAALAETVGDTALTLGGSSSWSLNAHNQVTSAACAFAGNATVSNVRFVKVGSVWSKPVSGTITYDSPFKSIVITFLNGTASGTVTGKVGGIASGTFTVTL